MNFQTYSLSNSPKNLIPNQNYRNEYNYPCNCCQCHCKCCCCQCPCPCQCHQQPINQLEEKKNNINQDMYYEENNYPQNLNNRNFHKTNNVSLQNIMSQESIGKNENNFNNYINMPINYCKDDVEGFNNNKLPNMRLNEEINYINNNTISNTTNDNSPIQSSNFYSPFVNEQKNIYDNEIDVNKFKYQEPNDIYNNSNRFDINYCNEYDNPKQNRLNRNMKSFSSNRKNIYINTTYDDSFQNLRHNKNINGNEMRDENRFKFFNQTDFNNCNENRPNNLESNYQRTCYETLNYSQPKRNFNNNNHNRSFGNLLKEENKFIGKRKVLNPFKNNYYLQIPKKRVSNRRNKLYIQKFSLNILGEETDKNNSEYNSKFQNDDLNNNNNYIIQNQNEEIDKLKEKLNKKNEEKNKLNSQLNEIQNDLLKLKKENSNLHKLINNNNDDDEKNILKAEIEQYKNNLLNLQNENNQLKDENSKMKEKLNSNNLGNINNDEFLSFNNNEIQFNNENNQNFKNNPLRNKGKNPELESIQEENKKLSQKILDYENLLNNEKKSLKEPFDNLEVKNGGKLFYKGIEYTEEEYLKKITQSKTKKILSSSISSGKLISKLKIETDLSVKPIKSKIKVVNNIKDLGESSNLIFSVFGGKNIMCYDMNSKNFYFFDFADYNNFFELIILMMKIMEMYIYLIIHFYIF